MAHHYTAGTHSLFYRRPRLFSQLHYLRPRRRPSHSRPLRLATATRGFLDPRLAGRHRRHFAHRRPAALGASRTSHPRSPHAFDVVAVLHYLLGTNGDSFWAQRSGTLLALLTVGMRRFADIVHITVADVEAFDDHTVVHSPYPTKNVKANQPRDRLLLLPNTYLPQLGLNPARVLQVWITRLSHFPEGSATLLCRQQRCPAAIRSATFGADIRRACKALGLPTAGVGAHIGKYLLPSAAKTEDTNQLAQQSGILPTTLLRHYSSRSDVKDEGILDTVARLLR